MTRKVPKSGTGGSICCFEHVVNQNNLFSTISIVRIVPFLAREASTALEALGFISNKAWVYDYIKFFYPKPNSGTLLVTYNIMFFLSYSL